MNEYIMHINLGLRLSINKNPPRLCRSQLHAKNKMKFNVLLGLTKPSLQISLSPQEPSFFDSLVSAPKT